MKRNFKSFVIISIFLFAAGILASAETYTWTGSVNGQFTEPGNWKDSSNNTPTWTSPLPAATYKILDTSLRTPYLPNDVTLAAGTTIIEVGTAGTLASLKLQEKSFRNTLPKVIVGNKGTLELSGTPAQLILLRNGPINLQPDSTVWYYGGYDNNIFPGPYQNLIVTGNIKAESLTVEKTTVIGNNNPVTITAATQTYKGAVTVQKDVTFDAETSVTFTAAANVNAGTRNLSFTGGRAVSMQGVTAGTVSAAGASSLTVNGAVTLSGDLKAKNLTVNTATVSAAKIEVSQAATLSTAATITAPTQTYSGAVTVNADTTFNASSNLTFGADGTVGGTGSMIIPGNGTVSIQNSILLTGPASKFEHTGTGGITVQSASNPPTPITIQAATQTYNRAVTIQNTDTVFTAGTSVTFKADVSAPAKTLTFNGNGTVTAQQNLNAGSVNAQNTSKLIISGNTVLDSDLTAKELETAGSVTAGNINVADNWQSAAGTISANDIAVGQNWPTAGIITAKGNVRVIGTFTQTGSSSELKFEGNNLQTLRVGSTSQIRYLKNAANLRLNSDITITDTFENNAVSPRIFDHNGKTVTFTGSPSKITGTSEPTFFHLTIAVGAGLKLDRATVKISGTFTNNGTLSHNNKEVIFNGLTSQIAGSTETSFYNLTVDDNKILHLGQNIIVAAVLKNKGIFKALGKTVTLNPAGTDIKIQGTDTATDTEFASVSCLGVGGKTLTVNGKITVAGNLNISGSAQNNLLSIAGPGEITLGSDQTAPPVSGTPPQKGYYLNIHTNIPIAAGHTYTVKKSKTDEDSGFPLSDGNPKNWVFDDYSGPLVWKGTLSSNWDNWQNWSPFAKPNEQTEVTIPRLTSSSSHYPNLGTGADPNARAKSVTVTDGAELDLGKYLIKDGGSAGAETSSVANNGTLKMTGTAEQKKWLEDTDNNDKITHGGNSTIQYNFGTSPAVIWAGHYNNLIMRTGGGNVEVRSGPGLATLTVKKDFTIHKDSSPRIVDTSSVTVGNCMYINKAVTLKTNTSGITVAKNTFIAAPAGDSVIFSNTYLKTGSFVLLGGEVTLGNNASNNENSALYATGDIVLFGSDYKANDTVADGASDPSGTSGLFTYYHSGRNGITADPSLTDFPQKAPDGTLLFDAAKNPQIKAGSFADLTGKTLKAGKNFYSNGMTLSASGAWTLTIPDNDNATTAFAEAYFTKVSHCAAAGGWVAAAEKCTDQNGNSGWDFTRPTIMEAYTVSDDTIYVEFSEPIENSNNEISTAHANIKYNNGSKGFNQMLPVDSSGKKFYLKTIGTKWNTDATGTLPGSDDSTDKSGTHQNIYVDLDIPKARPGVYVTLRDEHKNRVRHYAGAAVDTTGANGKRYGKTEDRCPPVLAAVYTGQEQHVQDPANQKDYDAHNFIEFRYSEPVYIGGSGTTEAVSDSAVNQPVSNTLGEITPFGSGLKIAGLATIAGGSLNASILFPSYSPNGQPHALYRTFALTSTQPPAAPPAPTNKACRMRISIAGYTTGTVTVDGKNCKKWVGCIENAVTPPIGTQVTPLASGVSIRERKTGGLELDRSFTPKVSMPSGANYGPWDTSPPVFAKAANKQTDWINASAPKEISAYSSSSRFADKMEFHFFDNTPSYNTSEPWWKTPKAAVFNPGWSNNSNRYDSYGGSRLTGSNRTTGGIRACTLTDGTNIKVMEAFDFNAGAGDLNAELQKFRGVIPGVSVAVSQKTENEALYGPIPSSPPGFLAYDTLYLQFKLSPTGTFPVTETFKVSYDQNVGRLTDLAGNRMKSFIFNDAGSISASPPSIGLTVAPVDSNRLYVLFTTQINTDHEKLAKIPGNFDFDLTGTSDPLGIETSVPAVVRTDTKRGTGLILTLTHRVTYDQVLKAKLKIKKDADNSVWIEPKYGGFSSVHGHAHALSDFAVNVVRPLFAYDQKALEGGNIGFSSQNLYGDGSYATRVFDGSGAPGNTVLEKEDITLSVAVDVPSANLPQTVAFNICLDNSPDSASVSTELNAVTDLNSRVWLPTVLPALSSTADSNYKTVSSEPASSPPQYIFKLNNSPHGTLNYPTGSRVGFLFPMVNSSGASITMDHDNDGTTPAVPLYALRLKDPNDPASIDLWSFDIASVKRQAGGASILNNVINVNTGEQTLIKVDTERAGSLSVIVMTLDGDVLKVLHSGRVEKGEHIYKWDGRNANGEPVARGLYFIRIVGPDIDETRKVMAVRE